MDNVFVGKKVCNKLQKKGTVISFDDDTKRYKIEIQKKDTEQVEFIEVPEKIFSKCYSILDDKLGQYIEQQADPASKDDYITQLVNASVSNNFDVSQFPVADMLSKNRQLEIKDNIQKLDRENQLNAFEILFNNGYIDKSNDFYSELIYINIETVCERLSSPLSPEFRTYLHKSLYLRIRSLNPKEIFNKRDAGIPLFWNLHRSINEWNDILFDLSERIELNQSEILGKIYDIVGNGGKQSLQQIIQSFIKDEVVDFRISDLLKNTKSIEIRDKIIAWQEQILKEKKAAISHTKKQLDDSKKTVQQAHANSQRNTVNLLSALHSPIDRLEELTFTAGMSRNLRVGSIHKRLLNTIIELRKGLADLGLKTVGNYEAWKDTSKVPYEPDVHSTSVPLNPNDEVLLMTLGFKYNNEFGEPCVKPAKVFVPETKPAEHPSKENRVKGERRE